MKHLFVLFAVLIITCAGLSIPARAFPVIDIANLIQNTLAAIQQIEQIEHQISQIKNQATSLVNEAKNLRSLKGDVVDQLRASTDRVNELMRRARGIAFDVDGSIRDFQDLYPTEFAAALSNDRMVSDTLKRWQRSSDALAMNIRVQSQAMQNLGQDESTLASLVNRSQSAEGALQATQITNQLLALHARQMIQDQQLRISQDRASTLEQARIVAANERARTLRQKFMTARTRYTPEPVALFHE
jgi:type IV secretion system protein TrbJ